MRQPWQWSRFTLERFLRAHGQQDVPQRELARWSYDELVAAVVERQREVAVARAELSTAIKVSRRIMDTAGDAMMTAGMVDSYIERDV